MPKGCTRVTAGIDVGGKVLWYTLTAWDERFGGVVIDYGCWPRQTRAFFAAAMFAAQIEDALFKMPPANSKSQFRSILYNLRDEKNADLRSGVLSGEVGAEKLVLMTSAELAKREKAEEISIHFERINSQNHKKTHIP